eukprot:scaffold69718_cov27-Tisochrysis_lutea.AAC.3
MVSSVVTISGMSDTRPSTNCLPKERSSFGSPRASICSAMKAVTQRVGWKRSNERDGKRADVVGWDSACAAGVSHRLERA